MPADMETLELTERELAIAQGEDPDAVETSTGAGETETGKTEVAEQVGDEERAEAAGQDANAQTGAGGGKEAASPTAWQTDEIKTRAAQYGLSELDLSDFRNVDEFRRATALLDRHFASQAWQQQQTSAKPEEAKPEETKAVDELQEIDVAKLKAENWDEQTIRFAEQSNALLRKLKAIEGTVQPVSERFEQFERQRQQEEWGRYLNEFHDTLDKQPKEIFGGAEAKEGTSEDGNRRKVFEAVERLRGDMIAVGRQPPPLNELVSRATEALFGEQIRSLKSSERTRKIEQQSRLRRPRAGGPVSRGPAKPVRGPTVAGDMNAVADEVANTPALVEAWNRMQEENGSR